MTTAVPWHCLRASRVTRGGIAFGASPSHSCINDVYLVRIHQETVRGKWHSTSVTFIQEDALGWAGNAARNMSRNYGVTGRRSCQEFLSADLIWILFISIESVRNLISAQKLVITLHNESLIYRYVHY